MPDGLADTYEQLRNQIGLPNCCDIGQTCIGKRCQDDIFPRIELIPSFVLSSDNTNCKNDIQ